MEKRDKRFNMKFTEEEMKIIDERMAKIHMTNKSEFIRLCAMNTEIVYCNSDEIFMDMNLLKSISDNVNQIARRVNSTDSIYKEDIKDLQGDIEKIWQQQASILSNLRKLTQ